MRRGLRSDAWCMNERMAVRRRFRVRGELPRSPLEMVKEREDQGGIKVVQGQGGRRTAGALFSVL